MADRADELRHDKESKALSKLQAAAGLVDRSQVERLDWMYEQSAVQKQKTDEELMNMAVTGDKDKDIENVKKLEENTAGSLFLKSATKTTEDMMRKLREDPLFQIRREEQAAKASLMANPLVQAKLQKKAEKASKKQDKKIKKIMKKEKKKEKKAAKKMKKAAKKGKGSSSSSSSDSDAAPPALAQPVSSVPARSSRGGRSRSPKRQRAADRKAADAALGPAASMTNKRAEFEALVADRKDKALASRGAPRRMSEDEKARKLAEMKADAERHEKRKDDRIAAAHEAEKKIEAFEEEQRAKGGDYLNKVRKDVYNDAGGGNLADRLKSQRNRRGKDLRDNLERD
eukprot:TRINITY_DN103501_c0_g1_i1.p1 TRINITY_DN103501_c0_g1~~TRINITY_DN103501_c0_g1_i1.p1  ORF type:complete len:369 (-),score=127.67 TRINITY_DN103501_c0_g1_i1:163-1191(-)